MKSSFRKDDFHRKLVFAVLTSVQFILRYFRLKFTKVKPVDFIKDDAIVK